ncbi:MAG TPA: HAMP domain-containing protein [Usitatibacter sp.]|jgi:HAMP domain-containing protein/signal transduction histidine kinase/CheY-like chemotaxis protein|nr:HAMP domain-containing protein [Usitatibacter sp.]
MKDPKTMNEAGSTAARRKVKTTERRAAPPAAGALTTNEAKQILAALAALKQGDSSVRLPVEWTGLQGRVAETFNEVVELNERMADELARLRQKVGKEGKLKQRAEMSDVRGFWRAQVSCVNALIDDLVHPTSETARVIGAVAQGDLSQTMALEVDGRPLEGEFLRTARTINKMVDQLGSFASEVTRVAREVGTEGKLGGQAKVKGVAGTWKDLTDSVNYMASNLTGQVRNIAEVTTAVALGDLSKKITVDVKGEVLELKNTINTMVDQLRSFASEVTRVAREVGTEGRLGGQAVVEGVSGTWKDLTDSVNSMASNLTSQVRNIADVTTAVARGDLSRKITVDVKGEILELKNTINTMVDQLSSFAAEVTRVAREVGTEGKLGGQAKVKGVAGTWKDLTDSVNSMAGNLTAQVRNIAEVTTAVATGDLSKKITVDVKGEVLELKNTINTMVDQLRSFASEVTRVAREVGTEGKLGGQARVEGVSGTWKDLTDSVNSMAGNLTGQVRNIADVTTAVARGDLSKKITVDVKGEILELKNTINTMVDQLSSFASEVTRVAREVGTEGRLGGQADVKGVAGTWKDLTDSVNSMASNLTAQVRNIAEVTTAVAKGDLSTKITVDVKGEILELKNTINTMVDQLRSFAAEVTRVAREVGTEGKLGGQADVQGVAGTWKDLTDSVNSMASNLTSQVRNIADVTTAVAKGDLSRKITVDVKGEILELKNTINTMVDQLSSFAAEVTRVAREVGTEGRLGGQADVQGVSGTWKDLTDSVNSMAGNLTAQVRNIADVTTAVARGDLSRKITVDVKGEILELKNTINTMVDQLSSFAAEVTRVAREVGTEGRLGGQADVKGVAGTWKDLTDSVNSMAGNLTAQVRNIAEVTTAVANGDLSKKITVDVKGEVLELKNTINTMVDQLRSFASEVTRVAREVGTEGKLGGQARVEGVSGTWKDLTDSVNYMASNLTGQVRNIADVTTAVARGDLSRKITVDVKGEILELKNTINTMVDQLSSFAAEVTRVAREVGTEGRLGGQADVKGVAGTWKDLTDSVNSMASNLTAQVRNIADVTTAVAKGDLSRKITVDVKGEILELKNTINTMVDQLSSFASEVTRVAREVGTEGRLGGQAQVRGVAGTWKDLTDSVNYMASNLTGQVRNIAEVTTAVAKGDLSKKITVDVKGEILELKNTINTMVDQLRSFAAEVTRVAREVGTEGKLGGQAVVEGVSGTWKDLTDSVNSMAGNLTDQVRGIAKVVTAVANGDLKQKLTVEAKGEIAALAETINSMIDTLATFAEQVTTVAREVGVEGQLGGQAKVPGASGTWKGLTENVNQLAENLTTQVRAIAEVATAVTQGDLTRSITVQAKGEVAALKDTINEMIRNLRDTTQKNTETDWLKTNLAKFSRMLQGQKDLNTVGRLILSELAPVVSAQHAEFHVLSGGEEYPHLTLLASYASDGEGAHGRRIGLGEGLVGQCALERRKILLTNPPPDYLRITSGLGAASPRNILVLPIVFESQVKGVLELASFEGFSEVHQAFLDQLTESIGIVINTIEANTRTEDLLTQSQTLAQELQSRQEELQTTNQELQEKARLLAHQNQEVERKNQEVEQARQALEEKARQLALTSKYKSEFLANMSHELRTPLNSLLILSDQLSSNAEGNLTPKQVEFARTIHSSGNDLLMLINDILDLSKIESGTVAVDVGEVRLDELQRFVERTFRHVAETKGLNFEIRMDPRLPKAVATDAKRLQQILRNLLSNAFKFTHKGEVNLVIRPASAGWSLDNEDLGRAPDVVEFSVTDTGIGIPTDKQQIIFEAFQQADGSTSRKYGGTGLGLAISRELSRLLRGEIRLVSAPNKGSVFSLYLPATFPSTKTRKTADAAAVATAAIEAARQAAEVRAEKAGVSLDDTGALTGAAESLPIPAMLVNEADDDRDSIHPGDRTVLIVENDLAFAKVLLESAREQGFKGVVTSQGTAALTMVNELKPTAMLLDIFLPDIDGWRVLARLKNDLATRSIPVHVISTEEARERALDSGARRFIAKPIQSRKAVDDVLREVNEYVSRGLRKVLVLEPDAARLESIRDYLAQLEDVEVVSTTDGREASRMLGEGSIDCAVVNPETPEFDLAQVMDEMRDRDGAQVPVIAYGRQPVASLGAAAVQERIPGVREVHSIERLLDQVVFALHLDVSRVKDEHRKVLDDIYGSTRALAGRRVLIVDDDIRNIFALSSVLEDYGMDIKTADNGREAIGLARQGELDVILMDIMMPEMDGLETMKEIRKIPGCKDLPIVAVTAKAMKGDRERCIEAGAWDYLSKPVDREQLLTVLKAWLHR